jgi:hypothetical protein
MSLLKQAKTSSGTRYEVIDFCGCVLLYPNHERSKIICIDVVWATITIHQCSQYCVYYFFSPCIFKQYGQAPWLTPVILATQEAEIRRIAV